MVAEVISLFERTKNGKTRSMEHLFATCVERAGDEKTRPNKVLVLFLNDKNENYELGFEQAGMSCSEMLALLEASKIMMLQKMELIK